MSKESISGSEKVSGSYNLLTKGVDFARSLPAFLKAKGEAFKSYLPELPSLSDLNPLQKGREKLANSWRIAQATSILLSPASIGAGYQFILGSPTEAAGPTSSSITRTSTDTQLINTHGCADVIEDGYQAGLPYVSVKNTSVEIDFIRPADQDTAHLRPTADELSRLNSYMGDVSTFNKRELGMNMTYKVAPQVIQLSKPLNQYTDNSTIYSEADSKKANLAYDSNQFPVQLYVYIMDNPDLNSAFPTPGSTSTNNISHGKSLIPIQTLESGLSNYGRAALVHELAGGAAMGLSLYNDVGPEKSPNPIPNDVMRSVLPNDIDFWSYTFQDWDVRDTCFKHYIVNIPVAGNRLVPLSRN